MFVSFAHDEAILDRTVAIAAEAAVVTAQSHL
jgi:hypothetical protein